MDDQNMKENFQEIDLFGLSTPVDFSQYMADNDCFNPSQNYTYYNYVESWDSSQDSHMKFNVGSKK